MAKSENNQPRRRTAKTPEAMKKLCKAAQKQVDRVYAKWSRAAKHHNA